MSARSTCGLCGEPMPEGEEMFHYHGFSGPCPKPPLPAAGAVRAEAFRASIAALDAGLAALPESAHRTEARKHLAAFALCAGLAAGYELLAGVQVQ